MGPLYCIALLTLCGIGVTVQTLIPERLCINKQHILQKQRLNIQKLITKNEQGFKWLETTCHLKPDIPGISNLISTPAPPITVEPTQNPTNYPPTIVVPPSPPTQYPPPTSPPFPQYTTPPSLGPPYPSGPGEGPYPPGPGGGPYPPGQVGPPYQPGPDGLPYPPGQGVYPPPPDNQPGPDGIPYPPGPGVGPYPPGQVGPYPPVSGGPPYQPGLVEPPHPPGSGGRPYPPGTGGPIYPPDQGVYPPPPDNQPGPEGIPYPPGPGVGPYPPGQVGPYPPGPGGSLYPPGQGVYPPPPDNQPGPDGIPYPPGPGVGPYPPGQVGPYPPGQVGPYPPGQVGPYPPGPGGRPYPPGQVGPYPPGQVGPPLTPGSFGPPYQPGIDGQPLPPGSGGRPYPPGTGGALYPPGQGVYPPPPDVLKPTPPSGGSIQYPPIGGQLIVPPVGNGPFETVTVQTEWSYKSTIEIEEAASKTTVELIRNFNYPVETHYVTTTDSYILTLHRIPRPGAQPIVLVHGLMSSSACWVQMGPSNGLAFLLYEQGFDVWMLNTRGNIYSKTHKEPKIKASAYWSFSFHEIGIYDLPNSIDQILSITKQQQVQYIGHSQGSTAFFVMCSELPHYNDKVILMQALSPTVYMKNSLSPVLRYLSLFKGEFSMLLNVLGGFEISRDNTLIAQFRAHICNGNELTSKICAIFDFVLAGFGWSQFNSTLTPLVAGHASQGASTIQIYHYAQLINGLNFRRYDKGYLLNRIDYKHHDPPSYNLTQTNCKVALHHSEEDWLSHGEDIEQLRLRLPNVLAVKKVSGFSHYDYLISKNVRQNLYSDVISHCQRHRYVATYKVSYQVQGYIN